MNGMMATAPDMKSRKRLAGMQDESPLVLLENLQARRRKGKLVKSLAESWPIAVGMLLALCAPFLSDILTLFKPWGMWLVFPFVELASRPELHLGGSLRDGFPQAMLFLQFPMEGLMAKKFLRGRVTVRGVAGQVLLYHFLGVVQLYLVWRAMGDGGMLR